MKISDVAKRFTSLPDSKTLTKAFINVLDLKNLSNDLVSAVTERALKQKDLVLDMMAKEFTAFLGRINVTEELQKVLKGMTLNLEASFDYKEDTPTKKRAATKKKAAKSKVSSRSKVKRKPAKRSSKKR
jgi:hypothetical protein